MSSTNVIGEEVSGVEQTDEWVEASDEVELRPSVEQEIQGKIDLNDSGCEFAGLTLAEEERLEAREHEIERTRVRFDRRQSSDREGRTRTVAAKVSTERRREFGRRAACVNRWAGIEGEDPREQVSREELGEINREAARLAEKVPRWSRAAISRRLAERVVDGASLMSAVVGVFEELQTAPGQIVPISMVGEVGHSEVSVDGTVTQLWEPSHPKIAQVGLLEDESGRVKFTSWKRSGAPCVREGERVVFRDVATSWYEGRVSVAVTGWSRLSFPERERWWAK